LAFSFAANTDRLTCGDKRVSKVYHHAQHITGHFGDKSLQARNCAGNNNRTQPREKHKNTTKLALVRDIKKDKN